MARIVVTGGGGFVGSHLCDALLERGDEVVCVENFLTSTRQNIEHLAEHPGFTLVEADVSLGIPVDGKVDGVFHMASPASPPEYLELPFETMDVNTLGTKHALDLARANDAVCFFASTSEIYGDPLEHPQRESYWGNVNPNGPRSVYDESKRFGETYMMAYRKYFGVQTRIVRIFNTYGPRLRPRDGRVVSNFLLQAMHDEPITIYGKGEQTRSFCYVADNVRGLLALFDSDVSEPVNIGNQDEFTIAELATLVIELTGSKSELVYEPLPVDDPTRRKPDISRARELLGWEPRVALREGLGLTYDWYRSERVAKRL